VNGRARRPPDEVRWRRAVLVAVGVALALRVGAVGAFDSGIFLRLRGRPTSEWANRPFFPDSVEFLRMAWNIRTGRGFMVSETSRIGRMPGYPVFLALLGMVFGERFLAYRLADSLLGAGLAGLLAWLGRAVFSRREGLVAAAIGAVYPAFVVYVVFTLSETLFMVLLVAGSACLAMACSRRGLGWPVLAGLFFGLAALVRASHLLCVPLVAVLWVVLRRFEKATIGKAAVMLGVFVACLVPWTARNWWASGGHLVVTTLRTGPSLYEGLNPKATGGPMMDAINWETGKEGMTEWEKNRYWRQRALEFARDNPRRVVELALVKLRRFWSVVPNQPELRRPFLVVGLGGAYIVVILLALVGLASAWRRWDVGLILVVPVVYHSLLHMVFVGSIRYRLAVMPLVVVLSAHGAVGLWQAARRPAGKRRAEGQV